MEDKVLQGENLEEQLKVKREEQNNTKSDVDADRNAPYPIGMLSNRATNIQLINKINEIINQFNKSLISNRI